MSRVFALIVLVVICVGSWFWWQNHRKSASLNDGEVACEGCMSPERKAAFLKENSGEDAEGQLEHKSTSHNELLEDKGVKTTTTVATTTTPVATTASTPAAATTTTTASTTTYPAATPAAPVAAPVVYSGPTSTTVSTASTTKTPVGAPPAYDTIAPNAPNGAVFTGSGAYQWYRQGNLTWRVDSRTGRSCIVFATDEEWRKERVFSHGCGKNA
ncbi:hypothetical protein SAMN05421770_102607 [Granulicella rosea]|uniref:Uncharacterized protein n=1 Tax=Granulicella rosea TaxID=474952 RepID=A0A239HXG2_9BACT|nr:hypothetical protein [Granulicella rosea]SNS85778.1 hypothetical protein SAMN05421770_102607 [Granulicella rosea]